jgi:hypothetical protein
MPLIDLDQFAGKTLYAKKNVPIITDPFGAKKEIAIAQAGNPIGVIFSYIRKGPSEPLYFMFYTPAPQNKAYYVEYKDGLFNLELLKEQGLQTVDEQRKAKEEEDKSTSDKLLDILKKVFKYGGIGIGAYLIFKAVYNKKA